MSNIGPFFLCFRQFPWERPLLLFFICHRHSFLYVWTAYSPADLADLRRRTPKQQNSLNLKQTVFLCVIMQLAAFLCGICVICGRIHIQTYSIYIHKWNPNISRWSRRFTQINPKTTKQPLPQTNCLSLRDNAACCIPLRDLRHLRENNMQAYSINLQTRNHNISRRSRR